MKQSDIDALDARIKRRARQIWLDEGKPEGRAEIHWDMARQLVGIEDSPGAGQISVEESMAGDVEPLEAVESLGDLPGLNDQGDSTPYPHRRGEA